MTVANNKKTSWLVFLLIVATIAWALPIMQASAIPFGLPFGGRVKSIIPPSLLCPFVVITVGLPRPGIFAIVPGTRLYPYYIAHPGSWVLGTALPTTVCLVPIALPILMMGVSQ